MIYENCRRIIEACCNAGIIGRADKDAMVTDGTGRTFQAPPEAAGKLIVYRAKGTKNPEGWYAEDLEDVARELMKDPEGQKCLLKKLKERGITPEFLDEKDFL